MIYNGLFLSPIYIGGQGQYMENEFELELKMPWTIEKDPGYSPVLSLEPPHII
jgi:hypothetical protein